MSNRRKRPDPAHAATDKELERLEKLISNEYRTAHREARKKLEDYLQRFEKKDEKWREWVEEGVKTPNQYKEWRIGRIMMGKRWQELLDTLSEDYINARKIAEQIVDSGMASVYALNHDYATYTIEKSSMIDTSYTLYSREAVERMWRDNPKLYKKPGEAVRQQIKEGKLKRWEKQRITSAMTQGILQGESVPDLTKRLEQVTGGEHAAAIRNARTMATGIQNAGRVDAMSRAAGMGLKVRKQWLATLDGRTRHEHRDLDGAIVDIDKPFENDFGKIMFPGDPEADSANIYNCRCTLLTALDGFEIDPSDLNLRRNSKLGDMSYEEWKAEKKSVSNPIDLPERKQRAIKGVYTSKYKSNTALGATGSNDTDAKGYEGIPNSWTMVGRMAEDEILNGTNPNYNSNLLPDFRNTKSDYTHNCTNCVVAYEMRKRGYSVTACSVGENKRLKTKPYSAWVGREPEKTIGNGLENILEFMNNQKDGVRIEITVQFHKHPYLNTPDGHAFIAERINGESIFIDPQTGRYDIGVGIFQKVIHGDTMYMRIDDLEISDRGISACKKI